MDLAHDYMTRDQAAAALHCTTRTLARYIDQPNGLPYVRLGGRIWIRKTSLAEWVAKQEVKPNTRRN